MLKIRRDKVEVKQDTEIWLEELGDDILIRAKLSNREAIVTIAHIGVEGMFIRSDIPGEMARLFDFATKRMTNKDIDYHSILYKSQYVGEKGD